MSTREAGTTPSVRPRPQTGWTELAVAVLGYVALCVAVGQARRAQGDGDRDGRIARGDQAQAGGVVGLDRVGPEQLHAHLAQPVRAGVAVEGQRRGGRVRERVGQRTVDDRHAPEAAAARPGRPGVVGRVALPRTGRADADDLPAAPSATSPRTRGATPTSGCDAGQLFQGTARAAQATRNASCRVPQAR